VRHDTASAESGSGESPILWQRRGGSAGRCKKLTSLPTPRRWQVSLVVADFDPPYSGVISRSWPSLLVSFTDVLAPWART
jgi:hypothetical protein